MRHIKAGACRPGRERGAAAVEMALVLPLLLLVIGGLVDFGILFYKEMVLSNAAREGARMVAMGYTTAQTSSRITSSVPTNFQWSYAAGSPVTCPSTPGPTDFATVTLTTPFNWTMLDVVPSFFGGTIAVPTVDARGTMRCQG